MTCQSRRFASGVTCVFTRESPGDGLAECLAQARGIDDWEFALVFFSKAGRSAADITALMQATLPRLRYAACSTAGEITPDGLGDGQIVVTLFPKSNFRIEAGSIPPDAGKHLDREGQVVRADGREGLGHLGLRFGHGSAGAGNGPDAQPAVVFSS